MNITELHLKDFRSARSMDLAGDLRFDAGINVFYGDNGAGKSTILDALAILLSWLAARLRSAAGAGRPIAETDINNHASVARIALSAEHQGQRFQWSVARNRPGRRNPAGRSSLAGADGLARTLAGDAPPTYPALAFYPVTRAVRDIPLRIRRRRGASPLEAYGNSLSGAADFHAFFEWFREREDLENEKLRHTGRLAADPQLEAVRRALARFLPGISDLTVKRSPLRMEVLKQGETLLVDQLSDGEKCLLAMVGDLARRLAVANGGRDPDVLEGEGIVLIDEVDLHLHPEWQRQAVPRLRTTFPNCQFFISTHSPLVLNQLPPASLFLLRNEDGRLAAAHPLESYGKSSARILEDLMGLPTTHTDDVSDALKRIHRLIADSRTQEARAGIAALDGKGFHDPELQRAETLIRRKELIGK